MYGVWSHMITHSELTVGSFAKSTTWPMNEDQLMLELLLFRMWGMHNTDFVGASNHTAGDGQNIQN